MKQTKYKQTFSANRLDVQAYLKKKKIIINNI